MRIEDVFATIRSAIPGLLIEESNTVPAARQTEGTVSR
jgi:hypothetical protein